MRHILTIGLSVSVMICPAAGQERQPGAAVRGQVEIGIPVAARRAAAAYPTRAVTAPVLAPVSEVGTFDLGRYPSGKSRQVRFEKPGVVKVFCDIHSHMSATVLVFDHPWFDIPDDAGRFELAGLPPGVRDITAWHERLGETTVRVRLEAGQPADADFTLPVPAR